MQACDKFLRTFFFFCCLLAFYDVQAAPPLPLLPLPPIDVSGQQVANKFASQTDLINVIRWDAPTDSIPIVSYAIYRDSDLTELAAIIPANGKLKFKDHNRKENHTYTYFLVSVDASGNQSSVVEIIFKGPHVHVSTKPRLVSIEVSPEDPILHIGLTTQFTAIGMYSDNTTKDLTDKVEWESSKPNVASISNSNKHAGLATGLKPGTTRISATFHGIRGSTTATVSDATLVSIEVDPANSLLPVGFRRQFTAIGMFSDGTTADLTTNVMWTSTITTFATINQKGVATGLNSGVTTIQATVLGIVGLTPLTVTNAVLTSIDVDPVDTEITIGTTQQFTATGIFNDNTTLDITKDVTWSSSNPVIASVSNAKGSQGIATGLSVGSVFIIATSNNVVGSTILSVTNSTLLSIEITPVNLTSAVGFTEQFRAIGVYSDGLTKDITNTVTWTSSNPTVAVISNASGRKGLATNLAVGSTLITASLGGISNSTTLNVSAAVLVSLTVTPANDTLPAGFAEQFFATGNFSDGTTQDLTNSVSWMSSNPAVASISNAPGSKGVATGLAPGTVTISAEIDGVVGGATLTVTAATLVSIAVTPFDPSLPIGLSTQFTATGQFSDGSLEDLTKSVLWTSSNLAVATISNALATKGLATALTVGTTTITATQEGISGFTTLTVTPAVLVDIVITPADATIGVLASVPYTATGRFSDGTTQNLTEAATWASANPAIATVSNVVGSKGLVNGHFEGTTTISATFNGVTGATSVTVTCPAITITTNSLPTATVGTPYSQTIQTSGGVAPIAFGVTNGTLPAGLTLDAATGVISGTATGPAITPTPTFTISATSSCGSSTSANLQIPINCPVPTFTSPPNLVFPPGTVGSVYLSAVTASGFNTTYEFTPGFGPLPPGLTFSANGVLTGVPTAANTYQFRLQANNSCGSINAVFTLVINP